VTAASTSGSAPNGTIVLAYSGGLDTSALVPWLKEKYGYDVVCCLVDIGRVKDVPGIMARAEAAGAIAAEAVDAKEEFAEHHCLPALMANALYEDKYPLVSALSRPLIAKKLVEKAHEYGATAVAHGCTTRCASTSVCAPSTRASRSSPRRGRPTGRAVRCCSTTWPSTASRST
jgi:argininosuccinate synthase